MLHKALLQRIRAEFLEMPGMRLTPEQVQRLCGVEQTLCRLALDTLVDARFLYRAADGRYARTDGGDLFRRRPAKADLRGEPRVGRAS